MKLRNLALGAAIVLGSATAANAAITSPTGWYMSLGAGANWVEDGNISEIDEGVFSSSVDPFSWDSGFIGTGAVGYAFNHHWRVEFEAAYRRNDASSFCEIFVFATRCGEDVGDMHVWNSPRWSTRCTTLTSRQLDGLSGRRHRRQSRRLHANSNGTSTARAPVSRAMTTFLRDS